MAKYGKKNEVKIDLLQYNIGLIGESGIGKEQPISEPVLLENGWTPMGDVKVGDKIFGEDGNLHNITGVFPQGIKDVYEVTFSDGTKTRCGLEHLWCVYTKKQRETMGEEKDYRFQIKTLSDILSDYKNEVKQSYKYSVPINSAINFKDSSDLKLSYVETELLLSDGKFSDRDAFIPKQHIYTSIENRIYILSRIIDTYGSIVKNVSAIVSSCSKQFAKDVAEIARSLGFIASISELDKTKGKAKSKYDNEIEYKVDICGGISNYCKSITDIQLVGQEECQCIMVDNPAHLYITNDYIVTHNTTIIYEMCKKLAGEDGYMFLECGKEDGADAIDGINFINCPVWSDDYDEHTNSMGFEDFVDDVIDNRTSDWKDLKVVVIDTYDQLLDIAKPKVIQMHNQDNPDKPIKSIKQAFGGLV